MREKTGANGIVEGVIWKQLLLFFFPILLGTFFQQLYNTVDTVIVGQYVGKEALAAVGTTGNLINLLVGFFVGLASGASVIISQFYGAGDVKNLSKAVHTAMALSLAGSVILTVVGILTSRAALSAMSVPPEVLDGAVTYMNVYYAGITAVVLYNVGTGILRAIGDSKMPLYVLIVCCLVNIVLDLLFVVAFHWDVFGVALATVLSQVVSAVLILLRLMLTKDAYRVEIKQIRFHKDLLKNILRIGLPSGAQSVMYSISNVVIQASINSFGTDAIAAWAAVGRIDGFVWMVMGAFGISVTTFVGQNFGARKYDRVRRGTRVCLCMTLGVTIVISALIFFFGEPLLRIFTGDDGVVAIGRSFQYIWSPSYILYVFIEIYSGAIRGSGESVQPMIITLLGVCGLRLVWVAVAVPLWHVPQTLALSYPVTWAVTGLVFIVYYLHMGWLRRSAKRAGHDPLPEIGRRRAA